MVPYGSSLKTSTAAPTKRPPARTVAKSKASTSDLSAMQLTYLRFLFIVFASLAIFGCGSDGPPRYRVHGMVTYEGKPVPAGTIIFEPDASQKNDGPQGLATIHAGLFDSAKGGKGTVGGPHRVTILG